MEDIEGTGFHRRSSTAASRQNWKIFGNVFLHTAGTSRAPGRDPVTTTDVAGVVFVADD